MLADLQPVSDLDLTLSGFRDDELDRLMHSLDAREKRERAESFDLEQALEEVGKAPARTKPGDLWLLGHHRLLCGDSTDPVAVSRLLASYNFV